MLSVNKEIFICPPKILYTGMLQKLFDKNFGI